MLLALYISLNCPDPAAIRAMLRRESARHPAAEVQDIYKLLFQATLGSEHATTDTAMARSWLAGEWRSLKPLPRGAAAERVVDTLAGGPYARVNLRPYRKNGGSEERLLAAFVRTGQSVHGSSEALHCAEDAAVAEARANKVSWSATSLQSFFASQRTGGDTAVHHSARYEAAYRPAYRVVALQTLTGLRILRK